MLLVLCVSASGGDRLPLSLSQAIELGLQRSPEVRCAEKTISAAQSRFWQAISMPAPVVRMSYEFVPMGAPLRRFDERSLEIGQSFEMPQIILQKGRLQQSETDMAKTNLMQVRQEMAFRITIGYVQVLQQQSLVALSQENEMLCRDLLAMACARVRSGESPPLDSITARIQHGQMRSVLLRRQKNLSSAREELAVLLAINPLERELVLTDSLFTLPGLAPADTASSPLLLQHAELKSLRAELTAAAIRKKLAWSSLWPMIDLSYYRQAYAQDSRYYGFSAGLSLPLWFLFEHRGKIAEARAQQSVLEWRYQAALSHRRLMVNQALSEIRQSEQEWSLCQSQLAPQAQAAFQIAQASYEGGEISLFDLLQTRQMLISVRENAVDAACAYQSALARYRYEAGITVE